MKEIELERGTDQGACLSRMFLSLKAVEREPGVLWLAWTLELVLHPWPLASLAASLACPA